MKYGKMQLHTSNVLYGSVSPRQGFLALVDNLDDAQRIRQGQLLVSYGVGSGKRPRDASADLQKTLSSLREYALYQQIDFDSAYAIARRSSGNASLKPSSRYYPPVARGGEAPVHLRFKQAFLEMQELSHREVGNPHTHLTLALRDLFLWARVHRAEEKAQV